MTLSTAQDRAFTSSLAPSGVMPEVAMNLCSVPPGDLAMPQATAARVLTRGPSSCPVTGDFALTFFFLISDVGASPAHKRAMMKYE